MSFPPQSIPLTGAIGTTAPEDVFPTHYDSLGSGGMRTVATLAARNAIPVERRVFGMFVFVVETGGLYVLANSEIGGVNNDLSDNSNWTAYDQEASPRSVYSLSSGLLGQTPFGEFRVKLPENTNDVSETLLIEISSRDSNGNFIYPRSFSSINIKSVSGDAEFEIVPKIIQDRRLLYRGFAAGVNDVYGNDPGIRQLIIHQISQEQHNYNSAAYFSNGETSNEDFTAIAGDQAFSGTIALVSFYTKDFYGYDIQEQEGDGESSSKSRKEVPMWVYVNFFKHFVDNILYSGEELATIEEVDSNFDSEVQNLKTLLPPLFPDFEFYRYRSYDNLELTGENVNGSDCYFTITSSDTGLVSTEITSPGTGYQVGDFIVIPSTDLEEASSSPEDDVTVTVTEIDNDGGVVDLSVTGALFPVWGEYDISDGGEDQYDGGNGIITDHFIKNSGLPSTDDEGIPYNRGKISDGSDYFNGGQYVVKYADSIFAMVSVGAGDLYTLGFVGNLGTDGRDVAEISRPLYDTDNIRIQNFEVIKSIGSWSAGDDYGVRFSFSQEPAINVTSFGSIYSSNTKNHNHGFEYDDDTTHSIFLGQNAGERQKEEGNIFLGTNAGRNIPGQITSWELTQSTVIESQAGNSYSAVLPSGGSGRLAQFDLSRDESGSLSVDRYINPSDWGRGRGFGYKPGDVLVFKGSDIGGENGVDDAVIGITEVNGVRGFSSESVCIGYFAGDGSELFGSVLIGDEAGFYSRVENSVIIGREAGKSSRGDRNIFIGSGAGANCPSPGNIVLGESNISFSSDRPILSISSEYLDVNTEEYTHTNWLVCDSEGKFGIGTTNLKEDLNIVGNISSNDRVVSGNFEKIRFADFPDNLEEKILHQELSTDYIRSVEYTIQIETLAGARLQVSKVMCLNNGEKNQYGDVFSDVELATFDVTIEAGVITLKATPLVENIVRFAVKFEAIRYVRVCDLPPFNCRTDVDPYCVQNFSSAWHGCTSLTSFPLLDVSSGTNFVEAWAGCSSLTSFPLLDVSNGTNFTSAWSGCSSLTSFPAGMFDTCSASQFLSAWLHCALSQQSVDNILVSLDTSGVTNGRVDITLGTSSSPGPAGLAAKSSLQSKGWIVNTN